MSINNSNDKPMYYQQLKLLAKTKGWSKPTSNVTKKQGKYLTVKVKVNSQIFICPKQVINIEEGKEEAAKVALMYLSNLGYNDELDCLSDNISIEERPEIQHKNMSFIDIFTDLGNQLGLTTKHTNVNNTLAVDIDATDNVVASSSTSIDTPNKIRPRAIKVNMISTNVTVLRELYLVDLETSYRWYINNQELAKYNDTKILTFCHNDTRINLPVTQDQVITGQSPSIIIMLSLLKELIKEHLPQAIIIVSTDEFLGQLVCRLQHCLPYANLWHINNV